MLSENISPEEFAQHEFLYLYKRELIDENDRAVLFKSYDSILQRTCILKFLKAGPDQTTAIMNQVRTKTWLSHPNLLEYYGAFQLDRSDKATNNPSSVILLEYCEHGNLNDFKRRKPSASEIQSCFLEILEGLDYLHQHGISHGNLKPENVILGSCNKQPCAKVADFGLVDMRALSGSPEFPSNLEYAAPEVIDPSKFGGDGAVRFNADLWSFGILLYEFFTGQLPFGDRKKGETGEQISRQICEKAIENMPHSIPLKYLAVIKKCLVRQSNLRVADSNELRFLLQNGVPRLAAETVQDSAPAGESEKLEPDEVQYRKDESIAVSHRIISYKEKKKEMPAKQEKEATETSDSNISEEEPVEIAPTTSTDSDQPIPQKRSFKHQWLWWFLAGAVFGALFMLLISRPDVITPDKNNPLKKDLPQEVDPVTSPKDNSEALPSIEKEISNDRQQEEQTELPQSKTEKLPQIKSEVKKGIAQDETDNRSEGSTIPKTKKPEATGSSINEKGREAAAKSQPSDEIPTTDKVSKPLFQNGLRYINGLASMKRNGKWGFLDKSGEAQVKFIYEDVQDFNGGYAAVKRDGKWGYVNQKGVEVVPPVYNYATAFVGGVAAVSQDNKWGFVDEKGVSLKGIRFEYVKNFSEGLAAVSIDGLWGFMDKKGDLVINPQYESATNFSGGRATVTLGEKNFTINKSGECVLDCI